MKEIFNFNAVEEKLGISFRNKNLLKIAFTHSSYANEHNCESNERLEFLGDSVLGFIVTKKIYNYTNLKEGELSKLRALLVSEEPLAKIVDELKIEEYMLKGIGESKNKVNSRAIKCDLFEAIVGAIYLDLGLEIVQKFVMKKLEPVFVQIKKLESFEDSKTQLQEKFSHAKIKYVTKKLGQDHNPTYESMVLINNVSCGKGVASNKRSAEQGAAKEALTNIREI